MWNESGMQYSSIDNMTEAFMDVYTECMTEAVPRIEVKSQKQRKKTPWWNNDVANAKCEVDKAKKSSRRRTPINFETLKKCEDILESVTEMRKQNGQN